MDEATVAKALQTDLNFHKVRIQVRWVQSQLYILASRDEEQYINYEFLFSLIQTRLEQLKIPEVEGFTLYGKIGGSPEPEWKKAGILTLYPSSIQTVDTLTVVKGKVEKIKSEYDPSHVFPHTTRLVNEPLSLFKQSWIKQNLVKLFIPLAAIAIVGVWLGWERSHQQQLINQAQILNNQPFNPDQPYRVASLESDRQNIINTLSKLKSLANIPFFAYSEAQTQILPLQMRLTKLDLKLETERKAEKDLSSAQKLAEAAIAKNPPKSPEEFRLAADKWQESIKILKTIPPSTFVGSEAKKRTQVYLASYQNAKLQLQKQLISDAMTNVFKTDTGKGIQTEMADLKSSGVSKGEFMNTCTPFITFNLDPNQIKKTQKVELAPLAVGMCNYMWTRK